MLTLGSYRLVYDALKTTVWKKEQVILLNTYIGLEEKDDMQSL